MIFGRLLAAVALIALLAPAGAQTLSADQSLVNEAMPRPAEYRLVWSDEFDKGSAPDPAKWAYDTSRNREGWYNNELQYYAANRSDNVRIEGGALTVEARKERLSDRKDYGGQEYSSGKIFTRGKAEWKYGFFEIRAKLACGKGTWPAIWMLGSDESRGWPALGEIDIMEHVGWDEGVVHGTIHTKAYNHVVHTQRGADTKLPDVCDSWHVYQLDWNADRILIGVDGHAYMRFDNDKSGDTDRWPFDKPQYLILNLAVGGWGGAQGIDPASFPARMAVDYVRVWQKR